MQLTTELSNLGVDQLTLARRLRRGELVKVRRGAYRRSGELTPEQAHLELLRATLAQTPTPSVASHVSAAVVHGLPVDRRKLSHVHLLRSGGSRSYRKGRVVSHRRPDVASTVVDGIPVTSLDSTVLDLLRMPGFDDGVAVADAALRRGVDREHLIATIAGQPGRHGNRHARAALAFADARSESPGESHTRVRIAEAELPPPDLQLRFSDRLGDMRADFGWREQRVLGEFDGKIKYGRALTGGDRDVEAALIAEKDRELRLRRLGWWVVRFVWSDLRSPARVAAIVREGFEAAQPLAVRATRG